MHVIQNFLLKCFKSVTKWLYPKNVSGTVQVLKKQIKVDRLDFFQKCIIAFKKFFLFCVPMKVKLGCDYSFMLKYSKMIVGNVYCSWKWNVISCFISSWNDGFPSLGYWKYRSISSISYLSIYQLFLYWCSKRSISIHF